MTHRRVHRLLACAWLVVGWAPTAACSDEARATGPLLVGAPVLRIAAPVFVARDRGLFRAEGLDVELRTFETAQPMLDDVALGRLDAGGFVAWPIVVRASTRVSEPLRTVASIVEDGEHRLSFALRRKGASLRFPQDAGGRRIGILPTVAYREWLDAILRRAGVEPASVTVVPLPPPMQAQALAEGGVDLVFTGDPMATAMIASGRAEVADDGPPCARRLADPFDFGTFVVAGATARSDPDRVRRLVRALDRAIEHGRRDPAVVRAALERALRPAERSWLALYPPLRYRTSAETPRDLTAREVARARGAPDFRGEPHVTAWHP